MEGVQKLHVLHRVAQKMFTFCCAANFLVREARSKNLARGARKRKRGVTCDLTSRNLARFNVRQTCICQLEFFKPIRHLDRALLMHLNYNVYRERKTI